MVPAERPGRIRVELVWSPVAGDVRHAWLDLAEGSTLEQGLRSCEAFADQLEHLGQFKLGIWGRQQPLSYGLRDRDRIEVYRPLKVDPKEARRQRFQAHGGKRIVSRHRPLAGKGG
ncbi:RnfH family protein [Pelomonas sp. SE-A7]|uniref:RnfH family protein n=1 Tax=Pelomonas sp. SE-A7 TaxID=3054953 RepID=UPI00259D1CE0|nr:RnfH family protein [Pelomonas sp. SE-A7]MDM4765762.1 RnfH family protein [Pelomonas sp. SE-A7]